MPNIGNILKAEIVRLSRRAAKPDLTAIKKELVELKHKIADQRKTIQSLERNNAKLLADLNDRAGKLEVPSYTPVKIRLSPKLIRAQRNRLGLSQREFALLLGVSTNTLVLWESGKTSPREKTRPIFAAIRKLGRREAKGKLQAVSANK
jgi:DNA-binding transcriptional regulator YiaG